MADRSDLIVGGYFFGSYSDAEAAQKELKNAEYLNERLNSMNKTQTKAVYDKMLDQKVFRTPVGWDFLKELRERLLVAGFSDEELRPIPLYNNFAAANDDDDHKALMKIRPSVKPERNARLMLRTSVAVNILLVILVLVMFFITLKSDNPNILNYKEAILNQYATWEQELTAREEAVREKEKALENSDGGR